jgi:hypothetical protein
MAHSHVLKIVVKLFQFVHGMHPRVQVSNAYVYSLFDWNMIFLIILVVCLAELVACSSQVPNHSVLLVLDYWLFATNCSIVSCVDHLLARYLEHSLFFQMKMFQGIGYPGHICISH